MAIEQDKAPGRATLWLGLGCTVALALLFGLTGLDVRLQAPFYFPGAPGGDWPLGERQPWDFLYHWGTLPGVATAIGAVLVLGASFASPRWRQHRYPALFLVLVMAIGPGIIVNAIGKGLWGRPRPADLTVFGGLWEFKAPFIPGTPGRGRSFLCGHASMCFYLMSLFLLFPGWKGRAALAAGGILGILVGLARMMQGSHFASDVLLCGTLMLALMGGLAPIVRRVPGESRPVLPRAQAIILTCLLAAAAAVMFLFSVPVYKEEGFTWRNTGVMAGVGRDDNQRTWPAPPGRRIRVEISTKEGNCSLGFAGDREPLTIRSAIRGFGIPGAFRKWDCLEKPGFVFWSVSPSGLYSEYNGKLDVSFSPARVNSLSLKTGKGSASLHLGSFLGPLTLRVSPSMPPPPGFTRASDGSWQRKGRAGLPLLTVEISADTVTLLP